MKNVIIIDSSYLVFRSHFAYSKLFYKEQPIGALFGYVKTVLNLIRLYNPADIYIAFDLPKPTWRHQVFAEYKAGRGEPDPSMIDQFPIINNWSKQIATSHYSQEGFEADDMINTLGYQLSVDDSIDQIIIFSADRDLYQMLTLPKVKFYQNDGILFGSSEFKLKYQLLPNQWLDFKALVGDNSDNIRGIPGIGPKTATNLLQTFQNLTTILDINLETYKVINKIKIKLIEKIQSHKDLLNLNLLLCKLSFVEGLQIPLQKNKVSYQLNMGLETLQNYGFNSLITEIKNIENPKITKTESPKQSEVSQSWGQPLW